MYYLHRTSCPIPADAPYSASVNERQQWNATQSMHQEALKTVTSLIDQSQPHCVDPPLQRVHANTRKFFEDTRKAEIGRENRKLVDRLASISKNPIHGAGGPPPLPGYRKGSSSWPSSSLSRLGQNSKAPQDERMVSERSLNAPLRRRTKQTIEQNNAQLVRRILAVKSTFDRPAEERDFARHQRASENLRKLSNQDGGKMKPRQSRSLPQLGKRPGSAMAESASGLEGLFLPGDLTRQSSTIPSRELSRVPPQESTMDNDGDTAAEATEDRTAPL